LPSPDGRYIVYGMPYQPGRAAGVLSASRVHASLRPYFAVKTGHVEDGAIREFLTSIPIIAPSPVIEAPRLPIIRPKSGCGPKCRAGVDKLDNFGVATHKLDLTSAHKGP